MKILTIGKILNEYQEYLTDYEISDLREVQRTQTGFSAQVKALKLAIFSEEWAFMTDSHTNPISQEHTDFINKKREAFGVSPVDSTGFGPDNSSDFFVKKWCGILRTTKSF